MVSIQFLGAAGGVTGSKHLLETPGFKIMVDCGLFQGLKEQRLRNWDVLPVDAGTIDAVIITHAHLDHTGYLPVLVKNGFKGPIYLSAPTADVAEIILKDSARLQEEDAEQANERGYSKHHPAKPLYKEEDVFPVLDLFHEVKEEQWINLTDKIKLRFRKNAHILGACFAELDCYGKRIVFSGDIGKTESLTLPPPEKPEKADILIIESTYGDRLHPRESGKIEFSDIINDTIHRKGSILIPSFAVGRAQELMIMIQQLKNELMIPDIPVFLDTPMGMHTTQIYCKHPDWHKLDMNQCMNFFDQITSVRDIRHTYQIIEDPKPKIIIAASGMLTGGRVLHHLQAMLPHSRHSIVLVGFQSEGTRGHSLQKGVHEIKIFGEYVPVKAEVREILGLSAHADQHELLNWLSDLPYAPEKTFVVHGEITSAHSLKLKLETEKKYSKVYTPRYEERFDLFDCP